MTATPSIDLSSWMTEQLSQASPDLLRQLVQTFAEALMSADADAVCGASYGQRSPDRSNTRNGYRHRGWDTRRLDRPGRSEDAEGSYFPEWLLERRRRAESAGQRGGDQLPFIAIPSAAFQSCLSTVHDEQLVHDDRAGQNRCSG